MSVVLDTLTVVLVVFALSFVVLTTYSGFMDAEPDFRESLNDSSNPTSNKSLEILDLVKNDFPSLFDSVILMVFVGLWIFALVSAFFINTHPIFFGLSVILLIAVFVVAAVVGNAGVSMLEEDEYSGVISEFPITSWLINHLFLMILVVGFSVAIVMFGKGRGSS